MSSATWLRPTGSRIARRGVPDAALTGITLWAHATYTVLPLGVIARAVGKLQRSLIFLTSLPLPASIIASDVWVRAQTRWGRAGRRFAPACEAEAAPAADDAIN